MPRLIPVPFDTVPTQAELDAASDASDELRGKTLGEIYEEAIHCHRPLLEHALPESTMDQLVLKLAFLGLKARFRHASDGTIIVESELGEHWFLFNHGATQLVLEQVL